MLSHLMKKYLTAMLRYSRSKINNFSKIVVLSVFLEFSKLVLKVPVFFQVTFFDVFILIRGLGLNQFQTCFCSASAYISTDANISYFN